MNGIVFKIITHQKRLKLTLINFLLQSLSWMLANSSKRCSSTRRTVEKCFRNEQTPIGGCRLKHFLSISSRSVVSCRLFVQRRIRFEFISFHVEFLFFKLFVVDRRLVNRVCWVLSVGLTFIINVFVLRTCFLGLFFAFCRFFAAFFIKNSEFRKLSDRRAFRTGSSNCDSCRNLPKTLTFRRRGRSFQLWSATRLSHAFQSVSHSLCQRGRNRIILFASLQLDYSLLDRLFVCTFQPSSWSSDSNLTTSKTNSSRLWIHACNQLIASWLLFSSNQSQFYTVVRLTIIIFRLIPNWFSGCCPFACFVILTCSTHSLRLCCRLFCFDTLVFRPRSSWFVSFDIIFFIVFRLLQSFLALRFRPIWDVPCRFISLLSTASFASSAFSSIDLVRQIHFQPHHCSLLPSATFFRSIDLWFANSPVDPRGLEMIHSIGSLIFVHHL